MKTYMAFAASALMLLSLGGCASQSQMEQQTAQLAAINVSLVQIQANQAESVSLQKHQIALQVLSNGLQADQKNAHPQQKWKE